MNAFVTLQAPASKSVSHRMLIGAALASGTSVVEHVLESKDLERTRALLCAAGAEIRPAGPGAYAVSGMDGLPSGGTEKAPLDCDVHESGTTCRILTAVLAAGRGVFRVHGAGRMHQRPIGALAAVLEGLGARIRYEGEPGCPPLVLSTDGLKGGEAVIGLDESSQYLSGLLLAAPLMAEGLRITLGGSRVVSWPYVGLTLQTLEDFGVPFRVETREDASSSWKEADWRTLSGAYPGRLRFHVPHAAYRAGRYAVEGDWSGASYLLAAGAVGRRPVLVRGLRADSLQGDRAMLDILRAMGAAYAWRDDGVLVSPSALHGVDVDMGACPDLVPTVAAVAALASGVTRVRNVAHLRLKESDRIAAPAGELRKAGVRVDEHEDGMTVYGTGGSGAGLQAAPGTLFSAHGDHRIAMSLALLELAGMEVRLDDPAVVRKSFPDFWQVWEAVR